MKKVVYVDMDDVLADFESGLAKVSEQNIITHCKNLLKGDYLIDDRSKNGTSEYEGERIQFGSIGFPDWDSALNCLGV